MSRQAKQVSTWHQRLDLYRQSAFHAALVQVVETMQAFRDALDELDEHDASEMLRLWREADLPEDGEEDRLANGIDEITQNGRGLRWTMRELSSVFHSYDPFVPDSSKRRAELDEMARQHSEPGSNAEPCATVGGEKGGA
jgi:hypothetical protein